MKTQRFRNKILASVLAVALIIGAVVMGAANYLVNYAIGRNGNGDNRKVSLEVNLDNLSGAELVRARNEEIQRVRTEEFLKNIEEIPVSIVADDGVSLSGVCIPGAADSAGSSKTAHRWVILIHGYRRAHAWMNDYAERYHDAGYQVLMPDLRGSGDSEGDFIGMGWPDRLDMLKWADLILQEDPEAEIVLHGVSMGAATTMMTSGEKTPDAVKGFIEDCGYTTVWDIFESELGLRFKLPAFPILYAADWVSDMRAGYGFKEASALEQVKKCEKPMMFIHGKEDGFIPFEMMQVLYDAKPGDNKVKIEVDGAGHGEAVDALGDEYWDQVFAFIDQVSR